MEYDFVYGDLRVQVIFKADSDSIFGQVSDVEVQAIQQITYLALLSFLYCKTLYSTAPLGDRAQAELNELQKHIKKVED